MITECSRFASPPFFSFVLLWSPERHENFLHIVSVYKTQGKNCDWPINVIFISMTGILAVLYDKKRRKQSDLQVLQSYRE